MADDKELDPIADVIIRVTNEICDIEAKLISESKRIAESKSDQLKTRLLGYMRDDIKELHKLAEVAESAWHQLYLQGGFGDPSKESDRQLLEALSETSTPNEIHLACRRYVAIRKYVANRFNIRM